MDNHKKRIGILGGTFDPIHLGHLAIAKTCLEQLHLDEVRFIPCQQNLLKDQPSALPWQRAAMVALAIVNEPAFLLDTRELERSEPSYSYLTLQSLVREFPQAQLFWLIGDDLFTQLPKWRHWEDMANCSDLVVVSRHNHEDCNPDIEAVYKAALHRIIHLQMPLVQIAACDVRQNIQNYLASLPPRVCAYILENKLYKT